MTGPEHVAEAEKSLKGVATAISKGTAAGLTMQDTIDTAPVVALGLAKAQVHATLALAAATEQRQGYVITDADVMRCDHGCVICGICGLGVPQGARA